jgi:uncharacterized protein (TIGR03435 family)
MRGLIVALFILAAHAQDFEAASIKAVPEAEGWPPRAGYWIMPRAEGPQRFRARIQVERLIEWAYNVRDFQVVGGPEWIREGRFRFAVDATAGKASTPDEMRLMLQHLLADRFHLKLHRETREISVYALVPGRNGPKVRESATAPANGKGAIDIGKGELIARAASMAHFVEILTDNLDRPVLDKTDLTGHYDFTLNYDQSSRVDWRLGPALLSLVQDLGLRLEQRKAPFEILVVDSVERPSEN